MKIVQIVNGKKIYLTEYLKIWNFLKDKIASFLVNNNYQEIFSKEDLFLNDLVILNQKTYSLDEMKIKVFGKYQKELEARTEVFSLLSNYSHMMKKYGYQVIDGYRDNFFYSGLFSLESEFIIGLEIELISQDNNWYIKGKYHHEIVEVINEYSIKYKLIHTDLNPHKFGLINFENNDTESLSLKKFLIDKYQALSLEQDFLAKEKFNELEKEGCSYIFEIRKKGKLRIKNIYTGEEKDLSKEEIESFLLKEDILLNQSISKINLINTQEELKQKTLYVCQDCFNELKEEYLKPFNQRVKNHKCLKCYKDADKVLIKIF